MNPNIGGIGHLLVATDPVVQLPHGFIRLCSNPWPEIYDRYLADKVFSFMLRDVIRYGTTTIPSWIMATTGNIEVTPAKIASHYDHDFEKVTPYYSSLLMEDYDIHVEYITSDQVAYYKFTFPKSSGSHIFLGSNAKFSAVNENTVQGEEAAESRTFYFYAKFSKPFKSFGSWKGSDVFPQLKMKSGDNVKGPATELDKFYIQNGFFPALPAGKQEWVPEVLPFEKRQSVTVTLQAAYESWCIAQIAKALGKTDDYNYFIKHAHDYQNVFNTQTGFMSPKTADGHWVVPFNPILSGGQGGRDYFAEMNSWIYTWYVSHDIQGLMNLMGGRNNFTNKLDALFTGQYQTSKYQFLDQFPDIEARNVSAQNKYIQSATLNGEPLNKPWFEHSTLLKGGTLVLNRGPRPDKQWGTSPQAAPPSMSRAD